MKTGYYFQSKRKEKNKKKMHTQKESTGWETIQEVLCKITTHAKSHTSILHS